MSNYIETFSTSLSISSKITFPGVKAGMSLYWSDGSTPEFWTEETAKLKITINDTIAGRTRLMTAVISNQKNSKEADYPQYRRVKVVEKRTGLIIFKGRVEVSDPSYSNSYGQILTVTARDYSAELFEQKVNRNYGGFD